MIGPILRSRLIEACERAPMLGSMLRSCARHFDEGSVVTIRSGVAAGMKWRRYHRFVNAYWLGSYELDVQLALQRLLRPGDVFYDVGANAGFFTVLGGRLTGPSGKVFAFEPVLENIKSVQEQIELNGLSRCEVVPVAVGAHSGPRTLSYNPGSSSMAHLGPRHVGSEREIQVQAVTLDEFTVNHPFPSLVKVDVEGAEVEVLQGAVAMVKRGVSFILELHGPAMAEESVEVLARTGYTFQTLNGSPVARPADRTRLVALSTRGRAPANEEAGLSSRRM